MFTPRPLVLTPPEFLADGAGNDLAVVGDEVREVGLDPVEAGAAEDGVGFEREFGGAGAEARDGDDVVAVAFRDARG